MKHIPKKINTFAENIKNKKLMEANKKDKRLKYVKGIRNFKRFLYSYNINWRCFWRYHYLYITKEGRKSTVFPYVLNGYYDSVLLYAFPWSKTKEGYAFWERLELLACNYFSKIQK